MLIGKQLVLNGLKEDIKVFKKKLKIFLKFIFLWVGNDFNFFFLPFACLPADIQDLFYKLASIIIRTPKPQLLINLNKFREIKIIKENEKCDKFTKIGEN